MDLMEALKTRRAVRDFTDEPVTATAIEGLVAAAVLAPSAMNRQPWAFAVVQGTARLRDLSEQARRHALAHVAPGSPMAGHLADHSFEIFHGAAALVIVCAAGGDRQSAEDCCLAGESLMLAAHAEGLGTCWIGLARPWLAEASVKAELGISADLTPVAPIIVGHPRARPAATPRRPPAITWCR
ncbi:nitroreductase family protein [Labrys monachus]|uniref:Nitroreductase n=1 Tax=Labrys monachus TaxID=217067 RepID=A0ABU0FG52_9HYPH|nr:nitroreductase [Labrys monachus]MDQ0393317.1 nitroreductase [Labrys monachus]